VYEYGGLAHEINTEDVGEVETSLRVSFLYNFVVNVFLQDTRTPYLHLSDMEEGMYTFVLKVTDSAGQTGQAEVHVFVKPPVNKPPVGKFLPPARSFELMPVAGANRYNCFSFSSECGTKRDNVSA